MKNLFFTAIAMIAFSFAGNANNLSLSKTTFNSFNEDCTWKATGTKRIQCTDVEGHVYYLVITKWECK